MVIFYLPKIQILLICFLWLSFPISLANPFTPSLSDVETFTPYFVRKYNPLVLEILQTQSQYHFYKEAYLRALRQMITNIPKATHFFLICYLYMQPVAS